MKYVATVSGVREVVLEGRADLAYWSAHLQPLGLQPRAIDGHAELMIAAFEGRWMGLRFAEFIVAAALADGYFLARAYNSNRFFAFVERKRFKTPYLPAAVDLVADAPVSLQVDAGAGHRLAARMGTAREPVEAHEESQEGPIHIPAGRGLHYFAKVTGARTCHPFDAMQDVFEVDAAADAQGLGHVAASAFEPTRWRMGTASTHARSKTFRAT